MNNDLISREALKKEFEKVYPLSTNEMGGVVNNRIYDLIDNAPTVEYPFYAEAYQTGFEEAKEKIIYSIAEQYTAHNELVPIWLSIGDIKGGAE